MLQRADHVFIGVIEKQEFEYWPLFSAPNEDPSDWGILRRTVRVENVLTGREPRKLIDIFEISSSGRRGASGDWNSTREGERDLFLVRLEKGQYHVVRDWWRSIFRISSGAHPGGLPLDDSRPFWERIALLMWWVQPDWKPGIWNMRNDPGHVLGGWREVKILRGLLQHPDPKLRTLACSALISFETGQDECWKQLSPAEQAPDQEAFDDETHRKQLLESRPTSGLLLQVYSDIPDRLRLRTTESNLRFRAEVCRLFRRNYPADQDNGCDSGKPLPATMVTKYGDVPLTGQWPVR